MSLRHPDQERLCIHFGRRIREAREFRQVTQADLGGKLGLHRNTVQKIETGEIATPAATLQRVAEILRVPTPWFFEGLDGADGGVAPPSVTGDARELLEQFDRIERPDLRRGLIAFMRNLADGLAIEVTHVMVPKAAE